MYHASMPTIVALLNGAFIASSIIGVAAVDSETPSWDDLGFTELIRHRNLQRLKIMKKKRKCKAWKKGKNKKFKKPKSCKGVETPDYPPENPLPTPGLSSDVEVQRCFNALLLSGFDITNLDSYSSPWLNETSVMTVADTGLFIGPAGMKEYLTIGDEGYVFTKWAPDRTTFRIMPVKAEDNECIITSYSKFTASTTHIGNPIDFVMGTRLQFTILSSSPTTSTSEIFVSRIDGYLPEGFLGYVFASTQTREFAGRVCDIMHKSCSSTFERNCYSAETIGNCVNDLLSLPGANEIGKIDGNSFGCRVLHAYFARTNAKHCAHISLLPEYDANCRLKCQKSKGIKNEDLFHLDELSAFAELGRDLGLGPKNWKVRE